MMEKISCGNPGCTSCKSMNENPFPTDRDYAAFLHAHTLRIIDNGDGTFTAINYGHRAKAELPRKKAARKRKIVKQSRKRQRR